MPFTMKKKLYLIFDFDGTLVDSFQTAIKAFNLLANKFNFRKIYEDEISNLKNLTSKELIKHLEIPFYKIPTVLLHARKYIRSEIPFLLPFANLVETLKTLHALNISLGILTSNSLANVIEWLERNNIRHLFDFIQAESSYFGKKNMLKNIIKLSNINKSKAFYVGDETRDIEAAKKNDIFSIAVTWGFNSEKILLEYQPHYLIHKPEDLLKINIL